MTDRLAPPTEPSTAPRLLAGRYRLYEELGRGGMATVHLAVDEVLQREVAVKLLHPFLVGDDVALDRFRREARAAAQVEHAAVVRVHDWGVDDAQPYLVMECVRGRTLRDVLRTRGRLTPGETLALLGPAAAGLAAAHASGLVHRDVTPGNLLVDHDGATKVSDFGLARTAASAVATRAEVVGSPHYLAPEAVRGEPLDARADVYALGCVLVECLTGTPPFTAENPIAVAARHTTERVPLPSTRVSGTSPALDRVVRIATDPDPQARYADAEAFALALSAAVPEGPEPVDLRDGPQGTVVPAEHATRSLQALGATTTVVGAPDGRDSRRRGRRLVLRTLRLLLVLALLAGGVYVAFDRFVAPITSVPTVVGDPAGEARGTLEGAGFRVAIADLPVTDPTVPEGAVVSQSTDGDARRLITTVELVLSLGPATAELPDLEGLTPTDVEEALAALDIDLDVSRAEAFDDSAPQGEVLVVTDGEGRALGTGTTLQERDAVTITVSAGPAPVEVPDLSGQAEADALAALAELGLEGSVADRRFDDGAPQGTVLTVEPSQGTTLRRGDDVALVVSDGPQPVDVPDVTGQREGEAVARLERLGLQVDVRDVPTLNPFRSGRVDSQDPGEGATLRRGDTVLLFVWR